MASSMSNRFAIVTTSLLMGIAAMAGSARAQVPAEPVVDFVVSPSRLEIRAVPGDRLDFEVDVYNRSPNELNLFTYVEDIAIPKSDLIAQDDLAFTASRWISFTEPELAIPGEDDAPAQLQVLIPTDTPPGGYHAFAFLQSQVDDANGALMPSGRIGVTLLLEVAPTGYELTRSARVADSSLTLGWKNWLRPVVNTTTTVANVGETHVTIGGLHTYRSWPGTSSVSAKLGPHVALRGTQHVFETSTPGPLFGKVSVTTEVVYQVAPDNLPVIMIQEDIWVVPWHLIGAFGVLIAMAWAVKRRRVRTEDISEQEIS